MKIVNVIKDQAVKTAVVSLTMGLMALTANANIGSVPQDLKKLSGAFKGETLSSKKSIKALIVPDAQKPGSFLVAILKGENQGLLLEGELISGTQNIGLSALTLSRDQAEIEVQAPPAALMQIVYCGKNTADRIEIIPQAGSQVLNDTIELKYAASDVEFVKPEAGEYVNGGLLSTATNRMTVGQDSSVKIEAAANLGVSGQFTTTYDVSNIGVLRGVSFDANYQSHESEKISALMIGMKQGREKLLIVGKPSVDGSATNIIIMKKK